MDSQTSKIDSVHSSIMDDDTNVNQDFDSVHSEKLSEEVHNEKPDVLQFRPEPKVNDQDDFDLDQSQTNSYFPNNTGSDSVQVQIKANQDENEDSVQLQSEPGRDYNKEFDSGPTQTYSDWVYNAESESGQDRTEPSLDDNEDFHSVRSQTKPGLAYNNGSDAQPEPSLDNDEDNDSVRSQTELDLAYNTESEPKQAPIEPSLDYNEDSDSVGLQSPTELQKPDISKYKITASRSGASEVQFHKNFNKSLKIDEQKIIHRSALGRDAVIGDLYNAFADRFCGISIFTQTLPKELIQTQDTSESNIQFITTDSISEKFDQLRIEGELKLSILAGLIQVRGSGSYFNDDKKSQKASRSTLSYRCQTKSQYINLLNNDLLEYYNFDALDITSATHIVQKINWGANAFITLESFSNDEANLREIKGLLGGTFSKFGVGITAEGKGESQNEDNDKKDNYSLSVHADVIPDGPLPHTVAEAKKFIEDIPLLVKQSNEGLGKPILFHLIPVQTVKNLLGRSDLKYDNLVKQLSDEQISSYIQYFEEIASLRQNLNDRLDLFKKYQIYLQQQVITETNQILNEINQLESFLKAKLAESLVLYRKGDITFVNVAGFERIQSYRERSENLSPVMEKIKRYQTVIEKGGIFIGRNTSLDVEIANRPEVFVLFVSDKLQKKNKTLYSQNYITFLELMGKLKAIFILCDLGLNEEKELENVTIWHIKNNIVLVKDYLTELNELKGLNLMRCINKPDYILNKPNNRIELELMCPNFDSCDRTPISWVCYKCRKEMEYAFDQFFYCDCGKSKIKSYVYKCSNEKHSSFVPFEEKLEECLSRLRPLKEVNILILGKTGVGKSTWLNSIVNYMNYDSLDEAKEKGVRVVIPASFNILNDDYEERLIKVGEPDKNEHQATGQSATQFPQSYTFPLGDTMIRLIDTPGVGDVRGIDKDKENLKNIIDHISYLSELHGICILLKPNETRLDVLFSFCIKELLIHLHKSAGINIIFCFTNSRSTGYKPGDTFPILKKLLADLNVKEITLSKHTIYCLDNESFRFLCTLKYPDITYDDDILDSYRKSWSISVSETTRLLQHIMKLPPHTIKETTSLVEARKTILTLTKPMAEITKNVEINLRALKDKKNEIQTLEDSAKDWEKKKLIPAIDLVAVKLDYPRTVCTSSSCVEYKSLTTVKTSQILYKTHCHKECYLKNVTPQVYPNAELQNCTAMGNDTICDVCGCGWEKHMHITYDQVIVEKQIVDEEIQKLIAEKQVEKSVKDSQINVIEKRISDLREEKKKLTEASAKFGSFLKMNAIAPYNDAMKEYLKYLIEQEEGKVSHTSADDKVLKSLRSTLRRYNEEVKTLDAAMATGRNPFKVYDIIGLIQDLYKLPIMGSQLKQLMEMAKESNKVNKGFMEKVVPIIKKNKNRRWF